MKKLTAVTALIAALMVSITASAMDEHGKPHEAKKDQETCPVMGGKINKKQFADVDGKRIYVCCPGCIGKIEADSAKYIKKLEDQGIVLAATPKAVDAPARKHDARGKKGHKGHMHH